MDNRPDTLCALAPAEGAPIRRLIAPNPSPMTYWGTNTYLIGARDVAVIDPGPNDPDHLDAILAALPEGARISHILVTHAHLDHSPLAAPLARATGAPIYAFGDAKAGQSAVMRDLAAKGLAGGGEGTDTGFTPDEVLPDGARLTGPDWQIEALWTPGHFGNHLSFALGDALFCGDLVMGWASTLVSPPDGDLTDFMASCEAMRARGFARLLPGHGLEIEGPAERLDWLLAHRRSREGQILAALGDGPATPAALTGAIYTDTPPALMGAAERNVFAHLIDLFGKSQVTATPELSPTAIFTRH